MVRSEGRVHEHPVDIFFHQHFWNPRQPKCPNLFCVYRVSFLKRVKSGVSPEIRIKILPRAPLFCLTKKHLVVGVES